MTNNSDKIRILRVLCFCLWPILEFIRHAALVNLIFKHFENLQNLILNILKETFHIP